MKKVLVYLVLITLWGSCKKETNTKAEESLIFEMSAGTTAISTKANYDFEVVMRSAVPAQGVRIDVSAVEEIGGSVVSPQSPSIIVTGTNTNASVLNLPRQRWVVATVKLTSVKTLTNTTTQSFRVIFK